MKIDLVNSLLLLFCFNAFEANGRKISTNEKFKCNNSIVAVNRSRWWCSMVLDLLKEICLIEFIVIILMFKCIKLTTWHFPMAFRLFLLLSVKSIANYEKLGKIFTLKFVLLCSLSTNHIFKWDDFKCFNRFAWHQTCHRQKCTHI